MFIAVVVRFGCMAGRLVLFFCLPCFLLLLRYVITIHVIAVMFPFVKDKIEVLTFLLVAFDHRRE